jgi:hypothetical protein
MSPIGIENFLIKLSTKSKDELQVLYDAAILSSRKQYCTSSGAKSLCLSKGYSSSKEDLQKVRLFLFGVGVVLKVGDRQCVDPSTKQKKSKRQKELRSLETDSIRVAKITHTIANKSKDEMERIRTKQKKSLKETLSIKMADKSTWDSNQNEYQHKAKLARASMTQEDHERSIAKWKETYWAKSDEDRHSIFIKKEKSNNIGFWLDGIWFGSGFELNMFIFLTRLGIKFVFQGLTCNLNGYTWHPDFYLPDHNLILEVKGAHPKSKKYWLEKTLPKIQEVKLWNTYAIRVCWERKIKVETLAELLDLCEVVVFDP